MRNMPRLAGHGIAVLASLALAACSRHAPDPTTAPQGGGVLASTLLRDSMRQGTAPAPKAKRPVIVEVREKTGRGKAPPERLSQEELAWLEMLEGPAPREAFLLRHAYPGGGPGDLTEVHVWPDRAELRWRREQSPSVVFRRALTPAELAELRAFLRQNKIEELPSLEFQAWDGTDYLYCHLTPSGGHRLYINNPQLEDDDGRPIDDPYNRLIRFFDKLAEPGKLVPHYAHPGGPAEMQIVFAHPQHEVQSVWADGDDVRVLIGPDSSTQRAWHSVRRRVLGSEVDRPRLPTTLRTLKLPRSDDAWVDEKAGWIYIVHEGILSRVPLSADVFED
jgi:hypothetical protein